MPSYTSFDKYLKYKNKYLQLKSTQRTEFRKKDQDFRASPTTASPTTAIPTTAIPTTAIPTTASPTTSSSTTAKYLPPHKKTSLKINNRWSNPKEAPVLKINNRWSNPKEAPVLQINNRWSNSIKPKTTPPPKSRNMSTPRTVCIGLILGNKDDMVNLVKEGHTPGKWDGDAAGWLVAVPVKSLLLIPAADKGKEDDDIIKDLKNNTHIKQEYQKDILDDNTKPHRRSEYLDNLKARAEKTRKDLNTSSSSIRRGGSSSVEVDQSESLNEIYVGMVKPARERLLLRVIRDEELSTISNPATVPPTAPAHIQKHNVYQNMQLRDILKNSNTTVTFKKIDTIPYQLGIIDACHPGLYTLIYARYEWSNNNYHKDEIRFDLPGGGNKNEEANDCVTREYNEETGKDISSSNYSLLHKCIDNRMVPGTSYNYYSYVSNISTQHINAINSNEINHFFEESFNILDGLPRSNELEKSIKTDENLRYKMYRRHIYSMSQNLARDILSRPDIRNIIMPNSNKVQGTTQQQLLSEYDQQKLEWEIKSNNARDMLKKAQYNANVHDGTTSKQEVLGLQTKLDMLKTVAKK